jgi:hypothetical protein
VVCLEQLKATPALQQRKVERIDVAQVPTELTHEPTHATVTAWEIGPRHGSQAVSQGSTVPGQEATRRRVLV